MNTDGTTSSATVAQTGEQLSRKQQCVGSTPTGGSITRRGFLAALSAVPLAVLPLGPSYRDFATASCGPLEIDAVLTRISLAYMPNHWLAEQVCPPIRIVNGSDKPITVTFLPPEQPQR